MRKGFNLLALVISIIYIGDYIIRRPEQVDLFGIDVPGFAYLLFWGVCLVGCVVSVRRDRMA